MNSSVVLCDGCCLTAKAHPHDGVMLLADTSMVSVSPYFERCNSGTNLPTGHAASLQHPPPTTQNMRNPPTATSILESAAHLYYLGTLFAYQKIIIHPRFPPFLLVAKCNLFPSSSLILYQRDAFATSARCGGQPTRSLQYPPLAAEAEPRRGGTARRTNPSTAPSHLPGVLNYLAAGRLLHASQYCVQAFNTNTGSSPKYISTLNLRQLLLHQVPFALNAAHVACHSSGFIHPSTQRY